MGSRKCSRSHGHSRSHRRGPPASPKGQTPPVEGHPGNAPKRWADSPSPMQARRQVTFEDSSSDSNTEMTPKTTDWSQPIEGDDCLPPSGDFDETAETVNLTQPVEGDDCLPLSGNSDKKSGLVTTCQRGPQRPTSIGPTYMGIPVWDRVTWQWQGQIRSLFDTQTIL